MKQYTIRVSAILKKLFSQLGGKQIQRMIAETEPVCPSCNLPWKPVASNARVGLWMDESTAAKLDSLDQRSVWLRAVILKNTNRCVVCEREKESSKG